jgi:hypothetical protein
VHTYHHPPPLPSTLSGLLKSPVEKMKSGGGIGSRSRAATAKSETSLSSEMNNNTGREQSSPSKSPSKKKKGPTADQNNKKDSNFDEVTHDRLFRIADDKIEQSDNFLVKTKNNRIIRVMLSDYDELDDSRINVSDLRKLLFLKPSIAELLYEEMLEIGLVEEELQTEDEEDEDTEGEHTHVETEVEEDETEIGTPLSTMNSPDRRPTAHAHGNDSNKRVLETRKSSEKDENDSRFGDEEDSGEGLHRLDSADL